MVTGVREEEEFGRMNTGVDRVLPVEEELEVLGRRVMMVGENRRAPTLLLDDELLDRVGVDRLIWKGVRLEDEDDDRRGVELERTLLAEELLDERKLNDGLDDLEYDGLKEDREDDELLDRESEEDLAVRADRKLDRYER